MIFHIDLQLATAQLFAHLQSGVHRPLQVPLHASAEVPEHGGSSGQHDVLPNRKQAEGHGDTNTPTLAETMVAAVMYLIEWPSDVNGTVLDDFVNHL